MTENVEQFSHNFQMISDIVSKQKDLWTIQLSSWI